MDDRAGRLESFADRCRVIGIDGDGRVVVDLPSKNEYAAGFAIRLMAETHPELTFRVHYCANLLKSVD